MSLHVPNFRFIMTHMLWIIYMKFLPEDIGDRSFSRFQEIWISKRLIFLVNWNNKFKKKNIAMQKFQKAQQKCFKLCVENASNRRLLPCEWLSVHVSSIKGACSEYSFRIVSFVIQADHVMCHVIKLGHFDRANFLKLYLVKYKEGA